MDPNTIKALLLLAAYEGAVAVVGAITEADGAKIEPDPLIQDAGLRKKGLCVYEEAKVQYAAILRAFQDKTGIWPDPQLPAPSAAPATTAGSVIKAVSDVVSAVVPKPPGSELVK